MDTLRQRLFGTDPDQAMLNYRGAQFMELLHSTELEEYVLALDSRITYRGDNAIQLADDTWFTPVVTAATDALVNGLSLLGTPTAPDSFGRSYFRFQLDVVSPNTIGIRQVIPATGLYNIEDLSLTSGISPIYDLPGTGYRFRVNTTDSGAAWRVSFYLRPQWSLGTIVENLHLVGEPVLLQLFGTGSAEPWATFRNLWERHDELGYSLGGLLLAMIYRTEEIRNG